MKLKENDYNLTDNKMILKTMQYLVFTILMVLVSCKKSETPRPKNLIPKDKMVDLLFDMHLANRSRNIKSKQGSKKPNYFPLLFEKYHIDSTQFKESHAYYMKELPQYIEIYKKLEDSIFSLLKIQEKQLKIQDSINKNKKRIKLKKLKKLDQKFLKKKLKKKPFSKTTFVTDEKSKNHR